MKHQTMRFVRACDGTEVTADEAYNKDGILKSGFSLRVPMFMADSAKSGFHIDDDGKVFKDGKPYTVPLELCEDGVARPTLDKKRKKVPNGEIEGPDEDDPETERIESDAATLLADGSRVSDHRPGFYRGPRDQAALDRLDTVYATVDAMSAEQYKTAGSGSSSGAPVVDAATTANVADVQSVEDCYAAYDEAARTAYLKGKG